MTRQVLEAFSDALQLFIRGRRKYILEGLTNRSYESLDEREHILEALHDIIHSADFAHTSENIRDSIRDGR